MFIKVSDGSVHNVLYQQHLQQHTMSKILTYLPGILLCFVMAIPAWLLGKMLPIVGSPVFGILFGMIVTMLFPAVLTTGATMPAPVSYRFKEGVQYTSKKLLQYAIILLGFEMNLFHVIKVGGESLFVMFFTLFAAFVTALVVGKALKLDGNTTILIGVGTSICGGSAIAATAPVIKADDKDVAHSLSTIFLFNVIAVFIFPMLGHLIGMGDHGFGMWAGTAINDTSSVVAASVSWSATAGNNTALVFATIVKLTRTLMIVPITLALALYMSRKEKNTGSSYKISNVFPWFVIGFVAVAILHTFANIPDAISSQFVTIGKFLIVMAMTAIGLNTHLKKLILNGIKPICLGLCCWLAVASVSLLVQAALKMW